MATNVFYTIPLRVRRTDQISAKITANLSSRDMSYEYCSCELGPSTSYHILTNSRVPIYSISSWSSIMSLKVAMWVDPIRDVYEVRQFSHLNLQTLILLGFHNIYLLPAPNQLPRRRASLDNHGPWPSAGLACLAA